MIQLTLPMPPSTNRLWRSNQRVHKSTEYTRWITQAGMIARSFRIQPIKGPYRVLYEFGRKDKRRTDLGNREKALSDLLQAVQIIEDDCLINEITLRWHPDIEAGMARVTIWGEHGADR